jgi:hypothetical protein
VNVLLGYYWAIHETENNPELEIVQVIHNGRMHGVCRISDERTYDLDEFSFKLKIPNLEVK